MNGKIPFFSISIALSLMVLLVGSTSRADVSDDFADAVESGNKKVQDAFDARLDKFAESERSAEEKREKLAQRAADIKAEQDRINAEIAQNQIDIDKKSQEETKINAEINRLANRHYEDSAKFADKMKNLTDLQKADLARSEVKANAENENEYRNLLAEKQKELAKIKADTNAAQDRSDHEITKAQKSVDAKALKLKLDSDVAIAQISNDPTLLNDPKYPRKKEGQSEEEVPKERVAYLLQSNGKIKAKLTKDEILEFVKQTYTDQNISKMKANELTQDYSILLGKVRGDQTAVDLATEKFNDHHQNNLMGSYIDSQIAKVGNNFCELQSACTAGTNPADLIKALLIRKPGAKIQTNTNNDKVIIDRPGTADVGVIVDSKASQGQ